MAAAATASSATVRYAPEDPTLPKPWKGLVDGKTGYLYFWNPETNVTQYERPVAPTHINSVPSQKSLDSSVQESRGQRSENADQDTCKEGGGSTKVYSGAVTQQVPQVVLSQTFFTFTISAYAEFVSK